MKDTSSQDSQVAVTHLGDKIAGEVGSNNLRHEECNIHRTTLDESAFSYDATAIGRKPSLAKGMGL